MIFIIFKRVSLYTRVLVEKKVVQVVYAVQRGVVEVVLGVVRWVVPPVVLR